MTVVRAMARALVPAAPDLALDDVLKAISYSSGCRGSGTFYLKDIHRLRGTVRSAYLETENGEVIAKGTMREVLTQAKEKGLL